jgi:hypothetical protein
MSANRHLANANRANRRRGESSAMRRLAALLAHNITPGIAAPIAVVPPPPRYSMKQFTVCNPQKFTGSDGATTLLQWFESMENTFMTSECPEHLQVRYSTSVFTKRALTWWNGQKIILGLEAVPDMLWAELKSLMMIEFCPENEIAKLEEEFHGLKQISGDNSTYTTRFHELSLLVPHQVTPESRRIRKYVNGLPLEVQPHVFSTRSITLSDAICMAASITDTYVKAGVLSVSKAPKTRNDKREASTEPKPENHKSKKTKTTKNYAVTTPTPQTNPSYTYSTQPQPRQTQTNTPYPPRKKYTGPHPLCNNCNYHHPTNTSCRLCTSCNRLGHFAISCQTNPTPISTVAPTPLIANTQPARGCFNCGDLGHFRNACPNLRIAPAPQPAHNRAYALTPAQAQVCPLNQLTAPTAPTPQHGQDKAFVQRPGKAHEGASVPCPNQAPDFYDYVINS